MSKHDILCLDLNSLTCFPVVTDNSDREIAKQFEILTNESPVNHASA